LKPAFQCSSGSRRTLPPRRFVGARLNEATIGSPEDGIAFIVKLQPIVEREATVARLDEGDDTLVVIVDRDPEVANEVARRLARERDWALASVANELAPMLLELGLTDRTELAIAWLDDAARAAAPDVLVVIDIDLLFEPSLNLDVLDVFIDACRRTRLLVAWPGSTVAGRLAYAAPGHARFQSFPARDVRVVAASSLRWSDLNQ
jgi:hypothetical protein